MEIKSNGTVLPIHTAIKDTARKILRSDHPVVGMCVRMKRDY